MLTLERINEAKNNFPTYLKDGLLQKTSFDKHIFDILLKNSRESIELAELVHKNKYSDLWVIVISYYSMFYAANAVLCNLGYKVGNKIAHKVTSDALIVLVKDKLKTSLLLDYDFLREDALAVMKSEEIIGFFDLERIKRGRVQYSTNDELLRSRAKTSLERAKDFNFALEKI